MLNKLLVIVLLFSLMLFQETKSVLAIEIERFEQLDTRYGLSQNNVLSIYCDHEDFMWFGTMDGLNRYDGYSFKIIKSEPGKKNTLTHNRISKIWEDQRNFLWVKTYDGYYHYYLRETGEFINFPDYHEVIEEKNSTISSFHETRNKTVWLGTTNSGLYHLTFDETSMRYQNEHYVAEKTPGLLSNAISFILSDPSGKVWVGTDKGLNQLDNTGKFQQLFEGSAISCGLIADQQLFIGTNNQGLLLLDLQTGKTANLPDALQNNDLKHIRFIENTRHFLLIGTPNQGLWIYNQQTKQIKQYKKNGRDAQYLFADRTGLIWLKTEQFGVLQIDPETGSELHFNLVSPEKRSIIDDERPFFYEDQNQNFWIGIHGGGLALYQRETKSFNFYQNDPLSRNTLSSDFVHCMAEDRSGLLWVGTGQINGGANKVILSNPSFTQVLPEPRFEHLADNVVRAIFEDSNEYIWVATKSGRIYIYNQENELLNSLSTNNKLKTNIPGNIYCIIEDHEGYIWLGSKGGGVLVSKEPIKNNKRYYQQLSFHQYIHEPGNVHSLSNNNVYTLLEDHQHQIWIGTYGGGLIRVTGRTASELICKRINQQNSNLSSNEVRFLFEDTNQRLWVATTFGLNVSDLKSGNELPRFETLFYDPDVPASISYNDVIHIFEDSKQQLWFGTFGAGVSILKTYIGTGSEFMHLKTRNGLSNDAVFSMLEDRSGKIWMGTENGISSYLPARMIFENYDINSGLYTNNYSENACFRLASGKLLFGSIAGVLLIHPETIEKTEYAPKMALTNFQLNNRNIDINDPASPIRQEIGTLEKIDLQYNQSSFSIEYAALSFLAPHLNNYAFMLENFENDWNYVGNQRKATYTNLSAGTYIFMVKAANWDGTWNEIPRQLVINIHPPWWRSTWALIIYFVVSLVLLEFARRIFFKYYRMQNDLQVERRVNDIKLQFFTNISHEIRTPLTLILGPIDDIKASKHLPPEVRNRINMMDRNGRRMLKLINQLLDFRKIQNKKMVLQIETINLNDFVEEICEHFTPVARQKQIDFQLIKSDTSPTVYVDPNKFDSVVFNLLSNAFKYTGQGKKIRVEIFAPMGEYIEIAISDEGTGISRDKLKYLFQRFTPLSTDDQQLKGTGIGLSLAYEIMQLHKGNILVESDEGKGSRFIISLRTGFGHFEKDELREKTQFNHVHQQPVDEDSTENSPVILDVHLNDAPLALIVEDNPEVLLYVSESIKSLFKVETAINGREALDKLKHLHPDVIITDVMMPEMGGIELTKAIKADFNTSHIPVVMLTAKSNMEDQIIGIESGAEAYLLKPFNAEYLRAMVTNLIKQRELVIQKYRDKKAGELFNTKITNKDDQFLNEIFEIIEKHFSDSEFNVEQLISVSVYSRTVLYNKVKGLLGVSPVDLIRQVRLKHAARLITEGGHKISEAAYACGFNDPKYFRKCFKTMFGVNPTEYKGS
jgi:signal transduction histidine kinase/ligand-binding sensor domain-containing protein/CheY-like chemotaxis protein/AraC-like DNA-binding protein